MMYGAGTGRLGNDVTGACTVVRFAVISLVDELVVVGSVFIGCSGCRYSVLFSTSLLFDVATGGGGGGGGGRKHSSPVLHTVVLRTGTGYSSFLNENSKHWYGNAGARLNETRLLLMERL